MLTEKEKEKIRQMSSEGRPLLKIAKEVGRDVKTVRKILGNTSKMDDGNKSAKLGTNKIPAVQDRGMLAARLFPLFSTKMKLDKIVITEGVAPEVVSELYKQWLVMQQAETGEDDDGEIEEIKNELQYIRNDILELDHHLETCPIMSILKQYRCDQCGFKMGIAIEVICPCCGKNGKIVFGPR